jgi:hypothetical protein
MFGKGMKYGRKKEGDKHGKRQRHGRMRRRKC